MDAPRDRARGALAGAAIAAAALAVYARTLGAGFVWDDHGLVVANRLLRGPLSAIWAGAGKDYWPLTYSALWLEWRLFGDAPAGYHAVSAALHAATSLLLWRTLRALRVPGAWLAGLLFAVHPVTVESVAWISERKNVLSAVPFLGATLAWVRWLDGRRAGWLAAALALFAAALLAKTSTVALPVVLLAIAWLRAGRLERRDVVATLPFLALALAAGAATVAFQHGAAMLGEGDARGLAERIGGAGWALATYLGTALAPVRLAIVYPPWPADPGSWRFWLPLAALAAAAALLVVLRDRGGRPWLLALGYHAIVVAPVLGLVDMAFLSVAPASNHLQYLPLMGPVALAAYGLARLRDRWPRPAAVAIAAVVALIAASTVRRAGAFEDERSLWTAAVREAPSSPAARYQLAMVHLGEGRTAEGVAELEAMARVARDPGRRALAEMLAAFHAGRRAEAAAAAEALLARERGLEARREAAVVLLATGDPERGIAVLRELVARAPAATDYVYHLAGALARAGRLPEAAEVLLAHLRRWPGHPELEQAAAFVLLRIGRPDDALARAAAAAGTSPDDPRARAQLEAWRAQAGWR